MNDYAVKPIGLVSSPFLFKNGTPRQATVCSQARAVITIDKSVFNNPEHSVEGLELYTHVWIFFIFHKNNNMHSKAKVKPPRLDGKKTGVFSTRSPYRPNNIGLTLAKIENISGASITVSGIDIIDGTPVIDLKPYIPQYDCPGIGPTGTATQQSDVDLDTAGHNTRPWETDSASLVNGIECSQVDGDAICLSNNMKISAEYMSKEIEAGNILDASETESGDLCIQSNMPCLSDGDKCTLAMVKSEHSSEELDLDKPAQVKQLAGVTPGTITSADSPVSKSEMRNQYKQPQAFAADWVKDAPVSKMDVRFTPTAEQQLRNFIPKQSSGSASTDSKAELINKPTCSSGKAAGDNKAYESRPTLGSDKLNNETKITELLPGVITDDTDEGNKANELLPIGSSHNARVNSKMTESVLEFTSGNNSVGNTGKGDRYTLKFVKGPEDAKQGIINILHEDTRSTYRRKHCQDSLYYFTFDIMHVTCWFDENVAEVVRVRPVQDVPMLNEKLGKRSKKE